MNWYAAILGALVQFALGWIQILKAKDTEIIVNETLPALKPSMPSIFSDLGIGVWPTSK